MLLELANKSYGGGASPGFKKSLLRPVSTHGVCLCTS